MAAFPATALRKVSEQLARRRYTTCEVTQFRQKRQLYF